MNTSGGNLDQLIGKLPRDIEPARDLWPLIEARTASPRRRSRAWDIGLAAGIAAVTVAVLFMVLFATRFEKAPRSETAQIPAPWAYQQLDSTYRTMRDASLERFRASADRLDPALRATIESNLAIIDRALNEIRLELARHPSDAALGQMLQHTYEQELAVIDAVIPPQAKIPDRTHYRGAL